MSETNEVPHFVSHDRLQVVDPVITIELGIAKEIQLFVDLDRRSRDPAGAGLELGLRHRNRFPRPIPGPTDINDRNLIDLVLRRHQAHVLKLQVSARRLAPRFEGNIDREGIKILDASCLYAPLKRAVLPTKTDVGTLGG